MEPQSQPNPESLPKPESPQRPEEAVSLEPVESPAAPETQGGKESASQGAQPMQPSTSPTADEATPATEDGGDDSSSTVADTPALADDVDVIEKEWVDKAKQIVDENKQDPYKQNKQVSVLKADYMKKRYGKDIKLTED